MDARLLCEVDLPAAVDRIRPAVDRVVSACSEEGAGEQLRWTLRTVLREALANAVQHGAGGDEECRVRVLASAGEKAFRITVEDPGSGYDPASVPDPAAPASLGRSSGRGMLLLRALADEVRVTRGGSSLTLLLRRP